MEARLCIRAWLQLCRKPLMIKDLSLATEGMLDCNKNLLIAQVPGFLASLCGQLLQQ